VSDLREALRQAIKGAIVPYDVPEWNQKVYIRQLTAREVMSLRDEGGNRSGTEMAVRMLLASIVDENAERLLEDDDLDLLLDQPVSVLMPLAKEAARLNGLSNEEIEAAVADFTNGQTEPSSIA
jgi:hypothetical protein